MPCEPYSLCGVRRPSGFKTIPTISVISGLKDYKKHNLEHFVTFVVLINITCVIRSTSTHWVIHLAALNPSDSVEYSPNFLITARLSCLK